MAIKTFYQNKKIFLAGAIPILSLFLYSDSASAQATYNALVTIPGIPNGASVQVYLSGLYTFLISVVGIVAMGAIVIGGARYLTSAGNPSAIEDAKHTINSAIIGLLLAITSWVIIREINPDITVLKNPAMPWSAAGYSPGDSGPQCALPLGNPKDGCFCVDAKKAGEVVKGVDPFPPYVVSTSMAPCATDIDPVLTTSLTITFNEPMDAATVIDPNAVTMMPVAPAISSRTMISPTTLKLDFAAALLTMQDYTFIVRDVTSGPYNKNISGVSTQSEFFVDFTTDSAFTAPCIATPFPADGSLCDQVCSNPTLALDGKYHCGWKFLRLTIDSSSTQNGDYYILKSDNELWEFFLTNKKDYGLADFSINATSYTNGPDTYDCVILISDEIPLLPDGKCVYWVKKGVEIRTNGGSLGKDIEVSGSENGVIAPYFEADCSAIPGGAFGTNAGNCACGILVGGVNNTLPLWKAHYTDSPILDRCGDCSFSTSKTQYRPGKTIICAKDASGYGVWRVK